MYEVHKYSFHRKKQTIWNIQSENAMSSKIDSNQSNNNTKKHIGTDISITIVLSPDKTLDETRYTFQLIKL